MDENMQVIPGNIVSQIKTLFDDNGITYWFDEECIYSGDAFARVIAKNIRASKILLFVSTANSNESPWTSDEIATARAYEKKIIPFRYDRSQYNESVILFVAKLDYIDYQQNPKSALNRLLAAVKDYLKSDRERAAREAAEAERLKQEEIMRQMQAVKEREMREKIVQLEGRRHEIINEILEYEKTLAGLTREKDFVEKDIADLRRSLEKGGKQEGNEKDSSGSAFRLSAGVQAAVLLSIWSWIRRDANYLIPILAIVPILVFLYAIFFISGSVSDTMSDTMSAPVNSADEEPVVVQESDVVAEVTIEESVVVEESDVVAEVTYQVGDYYDDGVKQGVVFDVWDNGKHGKIVSLDQTEKLWCTYTQYDKGIVTGTSSESDGKANTDKVMARADSSQYPAFQWCRAKGAEWYLPAKYELNLLLHYDEVYKAVNKTLKQQGADKLSEKGAYVGYWSSSEYVDNNQFCAWYVGMYYGFTDFNTKFSNYYVRAVSAF